MTRRDRQSGFTLVETLASFAILALILTVLLGGISGMATGGRRAEIKLEALRLAQARLDAIGVTEPLPLGGGSGRFDNGFEWRLQVGAVAGESRTGISGAWIEVAVWPQGQPAQAPPLVALTTYRLLERASR